MAIVSLDEFLRLQQQTERAYLIMIDELKKSSIKFKSLEAYIFTDIKTTGIKGDNRVYAYPLFITINMPAGYFWDCDVLGRISTKICNECEDITRVVYNTSGHSLDDFVVR